MTSQPHSDAEIREQVKLILGRMHYRTVHYETPKIDVPHKIDDTCPYKCMETATKAILALIEEQTRLARIDEVKLMKNFVHAETKRGGSAVYGFNKAVGYFRFKADERIDALQTNNKEEEV